MIGKTFLRLERDFDKHVCYCRDEPAAQEFLANNEDVRDFYAVSQLSSSFPRHLLEISTIIKKLDFQVLIWQKANQHKENFKNFNFRKKLNVLNIIRRHRLSWISFCLFMLHQMIFRKHFWYNVFCMLHFRNEGRCQRLRGIYESFVG